MLSDFKTNSDPHGTSKAPHSIIHHPLLVIEFSWYHGTSGASFNYSVSATLSQSKPIFMVPWHQRGLIKSHDISYYHKANSSPSWYHSTSGASFNHTLAKSQNLW